MQPSALLIAWEEGRTKGGRRENGKGTGGGLRREERETKKEGREKIRGGGNGEYYEGCGEWWKSE